MDRHDRSGWVVVGGGEIDQLWAMGFECSLQVVKPHPVCVNRDSHYIYTPDAGNVENAKIGWVRREQDIALAQQRLYSQIKRLLTATCDKNLFGLAIDTERSHIIADRLPQRGVSFRFLIGNRRR